MNRFLIEAERNALNETQKRMIEEYVRHFLTGNVKHYNKGYWLFIKDKGPIIETYMGFNNFIRDPTGMRAEFRGIQLFCRI